MKKILVCILVLTLIICDATTKEFIETSWKVTELTENGKTIDVAHDVILTIKSATEFTLQLDKNSCFGTYTITGSNKMQLSDLSCTEMCCDSDFSMAVSKALYKVGKVKFDKEYATLSGDDIKIKFKKQDPLLKAKQPMGKEVGKYTKGGKITTNETTDIGLITKPSDDQLQYGNGISNSDAITLYKSPCKGPCQEFTLVLYKDGTVVYDGKFNAKLQGRKLLKVDRSEFDELFSKFEQSSFTNFSAKYDDETIMDIQNTYLTYKGKKIHIRYPPNAPDALISLLKRVEEKAEEILKQL
jgi:heat shock protein HslJ